MNVPKCLLSFMGNINTTHCSSIAKSMTLIHKVVKYVPSL